MTATAQPPRLAAVTEAQALEAPEPPNRTWTVHWEELHVIADFSCWEGWELRGKVTTTVLRGSVIVENERFVGSTSGGQFVPRKLLPEIVSWPPDYSFTHVSVGVPVAA